MATQVLIRPSEAAELLGVSASAIREWVRAGHLPTVVTPGGRYLLDRRAVERLATPTLLDPADAPDAA